MRVRRRRLALRDLRGRGACSRRSSGSLPALADPARRPRFRDQGDFFYPLKLYTADRLRAGEIPLWNPLSGTGEPWLANGQSGVFYPPTLLFLLPSPALAGALFLLLHFAIAAWGARRFLKEENVSDAGALFGAAVFAASGLAASLSVYWNHFGAWAYLPGIAALARSGLRTRAATLGFGALVGLAGDGGQPGDVGRHGRAGRRSRLESARGVSRAPVAAAARASGCGAAPPGSALGLALAAWVLVPMAELAVHSDRRDAFSAAGARRWARSGWRDCRLDVAASRPLPSAASYLATLFLPPFVARRRGRGVSRGPSPPSGAAARGLRRGSASCSPRRGPPGAWLRAPPAARPRPVPGEVARVDARSAIAMLAGLGFDALRFSPGGVRGPRASSAGRRGGARRGGAVAAFAAGAPVLLRRQPPRSACWRSALGRRPLAGAASRRRGGRGSGRARSPSALAPVPRFAPEAQVRRPARDPSTPLSRVPGRIAHAADGRRSRAGSLRDGSFDAAMLARQREALLGYTNLTCRVPTVRTAAPLPTAAAAAIECVDRRGRGCAAGGRRERAGRSGRRFRRRGCPRERIGDFYRAPLAPYRPRLSFVRGYRVEPDAGARLGARGVGRGRPDARGPARPASRAGPGGPRTEHPMLLARLAEDAPERVVAELTASYPGLLVLDGPRLSGLDRGGGRPPAADPAGRRLLPRGGPAGRRRIASCFATGRSSFYAGAGGLRRSRCSSLLVLWHAGEPIRARRRA